MERRTEIQTAISHPAMSRWDKKLMNWLELLLSSVQSRGAISSLVNGMIPC